VAAAEETVGGSTGGGHTDARRWRTPARPARLGRIQEIRQAPARVGHDRSRRRDGGMP
jgi:hypothetical protein